MSGIYIKNAEIPKRCGNCGWYSLPDNGCRVDTEGRILKIEDALNGRPVWCPLIEVPDHGRLIDADWFEQWYVDDDADWDDMHVPIGVIRQNIKDTPTIIPADE